jgi:hypothetical protein
MLSQLLERFIGIVVSSTYISYSYKIKFDLQKRFEYKEMEPIHKIHNNTGILKKK